MEIHLDFETRSKCDLIKRGAWVYSKDKSTGILCICYAFGDGAVKLSHPAYPQIKAKNWPPKDLLDAVSDRSNTIHAHNSFFEMSIWGNVLEGRFGGIHILDSQWRCTLSIAAFHSLPRSLDGVSKALDLEHRKDLSGKRAMLRCSKPTKGGEWHEKKEDLLTTFAYCMDDVRVERAVEDRLCPLPPSELLVWQLDQKINKRGILFDKVLAENAIEIAEEAKAAANISIFEMTDGAVMTTGARKDFDEWTYWKGYDFKGKSLAAGLIPEYLADPKIPKIVKDAIELKSSVSVASVNKYKAILRLMDDSDNRVRDGLRYYGASTGRWSGKGVQIQNLSRGYGKEMEDVCRALHKKDLGYIEFMYGDKPMQALKKATRGAIICPPDTEMLIADYSSVEARGLAWLAGDDEAVEIFNTADIYCDMASEIYGYPVNKKDHPLERQLGKGAILGCFGAETLVYTDNGLKKIIDVQITDKLWDGIEWVSHQGLVDQGVKKTLNLMGVRVTPDHKIMTIHNGWKSAKNLKSFDALSRSALVCARNATKRAKFSGTLNDLWFDADTRCKKAPTYDIKNSGPQHRYTIQTAKGPLIVHNCGYGMGYAKFFSTITQNGITLSTELVKKMVPPDELEHLKKQVIADAPQLAKSEIDVKENFAALVGSKYIVNKYRDKYPLVKKLWYDMEWAALEAMRNPNTKIPVSKVIWEYVPEYGFLQCESPSGRKLNYHMPIVGTSIRAIFKATNKKGQKIKIGFNKINAITDEAVKAKRIAESRGYTLDSDEPDIWESQKLSYLKAEAGRAMRTDTYGGRLVENICQAVCRDLMAEAMLNAEKQGFPITFTVHDEVIAETKKGERTLKEFEDILCHLPPWAEGFPLAAEGEIMERYRK